MLLFLAWPSYYWRASAFTVPYQSTKGRSTTTVSPSRALVSTILQSSLLENEGMPPVTTTTTPPYCIPLQDVRLDDLPLVGGYV
jgi:hypothetical protein